MERKNTKVKKICKNCGKEFKVKKYRKDTAKYCSRSCVAQQGCKPNTQVKKICKNCGKPFKIQYYRKDTAKYCSKSCAGANQGKPNTQVKKICKNCGKEFKVKKYRKYDAIFCSRSCTSSWHARDKCGEKNPAWRGGTSFEPYCKLFNEDFKERVRDFWGRKCAITGLTEEENGRKLAVHHVNYDKQSCCNTTKPLFISLSASFHSKTNKNRKYWEEMFTNYIMIWYDGECYNR